MTNAVVPTVEPEAVPVPQAGRMIGCGRSKVYELLSDGELPSLLLGGKRLVRVAAIRALLAKLEQADIDRRNLAAEADKEQLASSRQSGQHKRRAQPRRSTSEAA